MRCICGAQMVCSEKKYTEFGYKTKYVCDECNFVSNQDEYVDWYVNVYEVDRVKGGSEEGGWWYDAGQPIESVRVRSRIEAAILKTELADKYRDEQPKRNRYSVIGGPDIEIFIEDHFAREFPERRPLYE